VAGRQKPAREAAQDRGKGEFWIDHAVVTESDAVWLARAERLTLWNVRVPAGMLARLPRLWWLDLRGGTGKDLSVAAGCKKLRYLQVNQVRGLGDLGLLTSFRTLEYLSLYGLAQVRKVPSLRALRKLARLEIGQLKALQALGGLLDAPNLEELLIMKRVGITDQDVVRIDRHRALERFLWFAEDVPVSISSRVIERIRLPEARSLEASDWFRRRKA
jgi:hypothetical protein